MTLEFDLHKGSVIQQAKYLVQKLLSGHTHTHTPNRLLHQDH